MVVKLDRCKVYDLNPIGVRYTIYVIVDITCHNDIVL